MKLCPERLKQTVYNITYTSGSRRIKHANFTVILIRNARSSPILLNDEDEHAYDDGNDNNTMLMK